MDATEIMKLPAGNALNIRIAKHVMHCKIVVGNQPIWGIEKHVDANGEPCYPIPDFSGDISVAWKLAELKGIAVIPKNGGGWYACSRLANEELGQYYCPMEFLYFGETAPLAICRAAFAKAMEDL